MERIKKHIFSVGVFLFSHLVVVPVYADNLVSYVGSFSETLSESVPVSGNVIAGVNVEQSAKKQFLPFVFVESPDFEYICLSVLSQDGLYVSKNTYKLQKQLVGPVFLDYRTKYSDELNKKRLALKTSVGKCGSETTFKQFLVSGLGQVEGTKEFKLYIDSLGATDVVLAVRNKESSKITKAKCEQIRSGRKVGFDFQCVLDMASIKNGAEARLMRQRNGRPLGMDKFEIK